MTRSSIVSTALMAALSALFLATPARAFCGVIQESATARTVDRAVRKAERAATRQVRALKKQHGRKLQLDERAMQCTGGSVAIDANGNQIIGDSSCAVTQPFCVNP